VWVLISDLKYNFESYIYKYMSDCVGKLEILKKNFNNYSEILAVFLADVAPTSSFPMYKSLVQKLVRENSTKIIDTYVLSLLVFEKQIMDGDEDFFLGRSFNEDFSGDTGKIARVFEFKSIW